MESASSERRQEGNNRNLLHSTEDMLEKINFRHSLRLRFLLLIFVAIICIEFLVFIPSITDMRQRWLFERFTSVETISKIIVSQSQEALDHPIYPLRDQVLLEKDGFSVALIEDGKRQVLASRQPPQQIDQIIDLNRFHGLAATLRSITTLFPRGNQTLLIFRWLDKHTKLELTISDQELRHVLFQHWLRFTLISLTLALVTSPIVFVITRFLLVRPLQRIFNNLLVFVAEPNNPNNIIIPDKRRDEVGLAQRRIAAIERELQASYAQQKHLADLGLAVSKINHDMRNILASAQLMSHYLPEIDDPRVKKLTPRLIKAIDHAVKYSQSVISYGRTQETPPNRHKLGLQQLINDVQDALVIPDNVEISFENHVPKSLEINVDKEQFHRILLNLCRNAVQALSSDETPKKTKKIEISAHSTSKNTIIDVKDNGPGLPAKAKEHLFVPFQGSTKITGSGLGLAICAELVHAHGGIIRLIDGKTCGTHFEIILPNNPDKANETQNADLA